jgi:hypothetical protein
MRKYLFSCLLVLAFLSSCAIAKPPAKKAGAINVRTGGSISASGICRGDVTGDGIGPYLKSIPTSEIYIDGNLVGSTPIEKLEVTSGSHLIELKAKGYKTSSIKLKGISHSGGIWIIKGVEASGHKKFTVKSGGGLIVTLQKQG